MAKTLYSATMSLDGFIAGPGGDMSWMAPYLGPNPLVDDLVSRIGTLLVGNRTFRGDDPYKGTENEGEAFGGAWEGPQFVLTHHPPDELIPGVTFVDSLERGLAAAKEAAGDRYVNVLGADVARQCLEAGELDEILMIVVPILLGDGVQLFDYSGGTQIRLEPMSVSNTDTVTNLWFRVTK